MMKGQIHEELNHLDNAREAYKQGVSKLLDLCYFEHVQLRKLFKVRVIPAARVGYEMVDNQWGTYNSHIEQARVLHNCYI